MPKSSEMQESVSMGRAAQAVIQQHHAHLLNARILYLFTTAKRRRCDRAVVATAGRMNALQKFLSSGMQSVAEGYDFIIVIGQAEWDALRPEQREAMLDHQLAHCWWFEKETKKGTRGWWGIRGHDVEEFTEVLARHGLWNRRQQESGDGLIRQLALDLSDRPAPSRTPPSQEPE